MSFTNGTLFSAIIIRNHHHIGLQGYQKYLCDAAASLSDAVRCSCLRCLWLVLPAGRKQPTETPEIHTLANIGVWELAAQTGSRTLDARMPTITQRVPALTD